MVITKTGPIPAPSQRPHRAQVPAVCLLRRPAHSQRVFKGLNRRKLRCPPSALREQRVSTFSDHRVETIPHSTRPQRAGRSVQFPSVQTFETMLGVRRSFAWAPNSLLRALLAQCRGSRRMQPGNLALGAHWRQGPNSWLPNFAGKRWAGVSSPHLQRNFWPPRVHNPLLVPIFASKNHHFRDISGKKV